jgi:putative membrane protein
LSEKNTPVRLPNEYDTSYSSSYSSDSPEDRASKTLIICIDRDDDIGVKTGLRTPIIGREACVAAATKFSISDPEEADANAIFAAVKEYDNLTAKNQPSEVALVSGLFEGGVLGDKKIRKQVAEVLRSFPADGAVLVSDGAEGEELVPVIQSLVPIFSLKRVVIKHSRSVEESYAVLGRYLRMLVFDPRYAKYALGVPGIIFLALVIIYRISPASAPVVLIGFIGIVFIIRGFDLDKKVEGIGKLSAAGYLRLFSVIASILILLAGFAIGASVFFPPSSGCGPNPSGPCLIGLSLEKNPAEFFYKFAPIVGYFIQNSEIYLWLGMGVYITTSIFFNLLRPGSRHLMRHVVELSVLALLYYPIYIFARTLIAPRINVEFFIAIVMFALAVNFSIAAYIYTTVNRRKRITSSPTIEV